jgi:hypothetical protein
MKAIVSVLFLLAFLGNTEAYIYNYKNEIGLRATYLSAVTYCPQDSVLDWSCYWCSKIPNFNLIQTFWDNFTSTFCYFGQMDNNGEYILAFEGSQDTQDLMIDLNFSKLVPYKRHPTAKVHSGFWTAYTSVRNEIYGLINSHTIGSISVVGHSLGGALATIASLDLVEELELNSVKMISLGAPRVGNLDYSKLYLDSVSDFFRLTHARDPIVHLPYRLMGFTHIGNEIFYPDNTLDYIECTEGENPRCANSVAKDPLNFTDHGYYMNIKVSGCTVECQS